MYNQFTHSFPYNANTNLQGNNSLYPLIQNPTQVFSPFQYQNFPRISYPYPPNYYQNNYYQQQPQRQNQPLRQRAPYAPQTLTTNHHQNVTQSRPSHPSLIKPSRISHIEYRFLLKGIIKFVDLTIQAHEPNLSDQALAEKREFNQSIKTELTSIKDRILQEDRTPDQALAFKNCQELVDSFVIKNYKDNLFLLAKYSDTNTLRISYVSSRIKDVIGHSNSDMIGLTLQDFIDHDSSVKLFNFRNENQAESLSTSFQFRTKNVDYITDENRYLFPEEFNCGQMYRMKVFAKKLQEYNENHIFMVFELKSRPWWSDTKQYKIGHFVCYCHDEHPFIPFLLDLDNVTVDENDLVKKEDGACFSETFAEDYRRIFKITKYAFHNFKFYKN